MCALYRDSVDAPEVDGAARAVLGVVLVEQGHILNGHRGVRQV